MNVKIITVLQARSVAFNPLLGIVINLAHEQKNVKRLHNIPEKKRMFFLKTISILQFFDDFFKELSIMR